MRLLKYINELWMQDDDERYEVLENPSVKEMKEVDRVGIRFIAVNKTKKLYAWNAFVGIHRPVYKKISKKADLYADKDDVIFGIAKFKVVKYVMTESDMINGYYQEMDLRKMLKESQWINSYIKIDKYFKEYISKGKSRKK